MAQTNILSDNFDSYTAGNTVASESLGLWETWGGTADEDAFVSADQANSGANSMNVYNIGPGQGNYLHDMVLATQETYTTGVYEYSCEIYVASGSSGYFNLGGTWTSGGGNYQYGGDFFFNADGTGFITNAQNNDSTFNYNMDTWNAVSVMINLYASTFSLSINGTEVNNGNWGAASGFGSVDIFGVGYASTGGAEITSNFYIDDVEINDWTLVGLEDLNTTSSFTVFPNPATTSTSIEISLDNESEVAISVLDLLGKQVVAKNYGVFSTSSVINLNTTDYPSGIYLVEVSVNGQKSTKKLVIK